MSGLEITPDDLQRVVEHATTAYPEECCGVLVGRCATGEGDPTVITEVVSADNERSESRHNRYLISPLAILRAQKKARTQGLDIVGYYHSHPDHPARPSDFDREHAWPGTSYLIVSVEQGEAVDARSWRLVDDRARFDEEPITGVTNELDLLRQGRREPQNAGEDDRS